MFSYKYTEKMMEDFWFNNARDMGKSLARYYVKSPELYTEFWRGFYEEYLRTNGDSERGPDKEGVDPERTE